MITATQKSQDAFQALKTIIQDYTEAEEAEDKFLLEQQQLSKDLIQYFENVKQDTNTQEQNKKIAEAIICHEHAFLEIYAGRRINENAFLQSLTSILEILEKITSREA
jgi:hypothetical protein